MRKRLRPSGHARLFVLAALATGLLLSGGPAALANTPVSGAAFTTVNESVDGAGHCQNGNPGVNCNIYDGKQYVWLNGGPNVAYAGDGSYFFAVLERMTRRTRGRSRRTSTRRS